MRVCVCTRALLLPSYTPFLSNKQYPLAVPRTPTGRVGTGQRRRRRVDPPASRGPVVFLGGAVGLPQLRRRQRWPPASRGGRRSRLSWSHSKALDHCPVLRRDPVHVGAALYVAFFRSPRRSNPSASTPTTLGRRAAPPSPRRGGEGSSPWPLPCAGGQGRACPRPLSPHPDPNQANERTPLPVASAEPSTGQPTRSSPTSPPAAPPPFYRRP